ncbi:MAG: Lrp/AsnC family transcriptional regulator [Nanoarchaeota archaeon]
MQEKVLRLLRKDAGCSMKRMALSTNASRDSVRRAFIGARKNVKKFTILPDFRKLGFEVHAMFLLEPRTIRLIKFLKRDLNVNSVFGARGDYSVIAYAIFRDMNKFADFDERVSRLCEGKRIHFIVEEVKQEDAAV